MVCWSRTPLDCSGWIAVIFILIGHILMQKSRNPEINDTKNTIQKYNITFLKLQGDGVLIGDWIGLFRQALSYLVWLGIMNATPQKYRNTWKQTYNYRNTISYLWSWKLWQGDGVMIEDWIGLFRLGAVIFILIWHNECNTTEIQKYMKTKIQHLKLQAVTRRWCADRGLDRIVQAGSLERCHRWAIKILSEDFIKVDSYFIQTKKLKYKYKYN